VTQAIHSKLINAAAREILAPMGVRQKGRSRLWYDDHGWWLILVEFQPSGFSRGTYLNVGVNWLWSNFGYFAFHEGHRVESFVEFEMEEQFNREAHRLAERAAQQVRAYRDTFHSIEVVADFLAAKAHKGGWTLYQAAVAAGICGRRADASKFFDMLSREPSHAEWHEDLKQRAVELSKSLQDLSDFRGRVNELIANARNQLRLKEWPSEFF